MSDTDYQAKSPTLKTELKPRGDQNAPLPKIPLGMEGVRSADAVNGAPPRNAVGPVITGPTVMIRDLEIPTRVDLGEQVVGGRANHAIALLKTSPGSSAHITAAIRSTTSIESTAGEDHYPINLADADTRDFKSQAQALEVTSMVPSPMYVEFAPARTGPERAILELSIRWSDGEAATSLVEIRGRGRKLTDAPIVGVGERPIPEIAYVDHHADPSTGDHATDFAVATQRAEHAAAGLARARNAGLSAVKDDAKAYSAPPEATPFLVSLVEVALSMGIAGVAGVIAKKLAHGIGLYAHANVDPAKVKDLPTVLALTDGLKEGIKTIGKKTIVPTDKAPTETHRKVHGPSDNAPLPESTNPVNAFFERHTNSLNAQADENESLITRNYQSFALILKSSPSLAVHAMQVLAHSLETTNDYAQNEQVIATMSQWVTGIANKKGPGTSGLDSLRADRPRGLYTDPRDGTIRHTQSLRADEVGILRIAIDMEPGNQREFKVTSAALDGISQEIADRLHRIPLQGVALPVLVKVHSSLGEARVSRSETGLVRVEGKLPGGDGVTEAERIPAANEMLTRLFSQSLEASGLPEIHTDDASGRQS